MICWETYTSGAVTGMEQVFTARVLVQIRLALHRDPPVYIVAVVGTMALGGAVPRSEIIVTHGTFTTI